MRFEKRARERERERERERDFQIRTTVLYLNNKHWLYHLLKCLLIYLGFEPKTYLDEANSNMM